MQTIGDSELANRKLGRIETVIGKEIEEQRGQIIDLQHIVLSSILWRLEETLENRRWKCNEEYPVLFINRTILK